MRITSLGLPFSPPKDLQKELKTTSLLGLLLSWAKDVHPELETLTTSSLGLFSSSKKPTNRAQNVHDFIVEALLLLRGTHTVDDFIAGSFLLADEGPQKGAQHVDDFTAGGSCFPRRRAYIQTSRR